MYKQEQIKPYEGTGDKGKLVEEMFDNIAPTYDTLNHRLSWDIDKGWRKKAIKRLAPFSPKKMLDIATGTGDFAILCRTDAASRQTHRSRHLAGHDGDRKTEGEAAGTGQRDPLRQGRLPPPLVRRQHLRRGNRRLRHPQLPEPGPGTAEMCRVLKKGGHLCIVELTTPVSFPMKQLFHIYSHTVLPIYGKLISKDQSAYSYLTKTIEAFPQGETMMEVFKKAGFEKAEFKRLTFGICTLYFATK